MPQPLVPDRASPLFLREAEIRRGLELFFVAHRALADSIGPILARHGLGHAHQRTLYFVARRPGLAVAELLRLLGITKQSLSRVVGELVAGGYVEQQVGEADRRQRLLRLTAAGRAVEAELFASLREAMAAAYAQAGQQAVGGFWSVLSGLVPLDQRAMLAALAEPPRAAPTL
jgi:DNA-binding MarR family transcriptional regulator